MHRRLGLWANKLSAHPAFEQEIAMSPEFAAYVERERKALVAAGRTLESVCNL